MMVAGRPAAQQLSAVGRPFSVPASANRANSRPTGLSSCLGVRRGQAQFKKRAVTSGLSDLARDHLLQSASRA